MAYAIEDSRDGVRYSGARSANTVGPFVLLGGTYMWATEAPSTSTEFDVLMPSGSYSPVIPALTTAGTSMMWLPAGTYKIIMTATGDVSGFVQRVPTVPSF